MSKSSTAAAKATPASAEAPVQGQVGHNGGPPVEDQPKAPFHIQVTTHHSGHRDVIVDSRICDIYDFQARKWLTNHQFWAMHNGHTVELHPATPDEITSYTQKQAQLLSRRYGRN